MELTFRHYRPDDAWVHDRWRLLFGGRSSPIAGPTRQYCCSAVSRSTVDVVRNRGIVEQALSNWVRQAHIDRGDEERPTNDERAGLASLRDHVHRLTMERDFLYSIHRRLGLAVGAGA